MAGLLEENGWTVHVVSGQKVGYDLFAQSGQRRLYVEVKSSLGQCSPSLTAKEWQMAEHYRQDFVLAVIEDFKATSEYTVYFVPDPSKTCVTTAQTTISYRISRGSWSLVTAPVGDL